MLSLKMPEVVHLKLLKTKSSTPGLPNLARNDPEGALEPAEEVVRSHGQEPGRAGQDPDHRAGQAHCRIPRRGRVQRCLPGVVFRRGQETLRRGNLTSLGLNCLEQIIKNNLGVNSRYSKKLTRIAPYSFHNIAPSGDLSRRVQLCSVILPIY